MATPAAHTAALASKLSALASLSEAEMATIALTYEICQTCKPGEDIQVEGVQLGPPRVVLTGWAYRSRVLSNGRRQVFGFLLPGDLLNVVPGVQLTSVSSIVALTRMTLGDAEPLATVLWGPAQQPGLIQACAGAAHLEQVNLFNQIMRLGSQTAYERLGHLLLELYWRLKPVGLAADWRFDLPVTQDMLADTLGLSVVHINRTVQHMRRDKMIELAGGHIRLVDPDALTHLASYRSPRMEMGR